MDEHGNSIVRELLDKYNYEAWSIQLKTYLLAQGLWDIVKKCGVRTPKRHEKAKLKVWTRKNAEALHVIQRSCGEDSFGVIKEITSAKIAWATLADEYGSKADYAPGTDRNSDFQCHQPLFDAVRHGNWDTAKTYLDQHPDAVRARIDSSGRTPLHIAVSVGHMYIVEELVQLMTEEDLLIQQKDGFTVLALSIGIGNLPIAKCLIRKNKELVSVVHKLEGIPVLYAVYCGDFQIARFLYSVTPLEDLTLRDNGKMGASLICECISRQNFDIPLDLLEHCPRLAITVSQYNKSPVWALSCCPKSIFPSGFQLGFWQRWLYDCIDVAGCAANQVIIDVQNQECGQRGKNDLTAIRSDIRVMYEMKLVHVQSGELLSRMCKVIESSFNENKLLEEGRVCDVIFEAVYTGNVEFIMSVTKANPELLWTNTLAFDVFMLAIECRQEEVFSLIHGLLDKQAIASLLDVDGNNMLHKAASIPSSKILNLIPGAPLQMQRQLQWFKEVETVMTPAYNQFTNKDFLRPQVLFTRNHKDLVIAGEK